MHELLSSTHWGGKKKKKKGWILAALDVLELGSAHTTALTHLLGTVGIPGLLLGGKAQHSTLHLSKQKYLRGTGEGDSRTAKAKHLGRSLKIPSPCDFLGGADSPAALPASAAAAERGARAEHDAGCRGSHHTEILPWKLTSCN